MSDPKPSGRSGALPRAGGRARAYPSNDMFVIITKKLIATIQRAVGATLVKTISNSLNITVA